MAQAITVNPLSSMAWHAMGDLNEILKQLGSSKESGLSTAEAQKRIQQ